MYITQLKLRSNKHWHRANAQGRASLSLQDGLLLIALLCTLWAEVHSKSTDTSGRELVTIADTNTDQMPHVGVNGLCMKDTKAMDEVVQICTWQGGAAGAASVSVDDSCTSCRELLNQQGFKGTYYLSGTDKFTEADWDIWRAIYKEGHEIGGHTTTHASCHILDEKTLRWELSSNRTHILTHVGMPEEELTSLAWPCGDCSPASEAIAGEYYISARGYHINELEDENPSDFMNLKSINTPHYHVPAYDPPNYFEMADKAEALSEWVSFVFHNHSKDDGAIAYLATKNLWVAPVGKVAKYIKERQNSHITNVMKTDSGIAFTLACSLEPRLFNQELTVRANVNPADVQSVLVNGISAEFMRKADHILLNVCPSGNDEIMILTIGPVGQSDRSIRAPSPERQSMRIRASRRLGVGNGAVINIWLSEHSRLDNLRNHQIKYLFVDVGDTHRTGKLETPITDIVSFLRMIKSYEKQHAYDFVVLPYSEINTTRYELTRPFRENFIVDYKGLISLGFDGIYVDVEPVRKVFQQDYLEFLNALSAVCSKPTILAVYAGNLYDTQGGDEQDNEWQWSLNLYQDVSDLVDLIVVPGYDLNIRSRREYTAFLRNQISTISSESFNCQFMFAVPTHKLEPETIDNALKAYNMEISRRSQHPFIGVCVFAEWTTIPEEWNVLESRK